MKKHRLTSFDNRVLKIFKEKKERRKHINSNSAFKYSGNIFKEKDQINIESFISHYSKDQVKLEKEDKNNLIKRLLIPSTKKLETSYISSQNYLRLTLILADNYTYENNTIGTLVAYARALNFIETHVYKKDFKKTRDKILNKMILSFVREESASEYNNSIKTLSQNLSPSYKESFNGLMLKAYLTELNDTSYVKYKQYLDQAVNSTIKNEELIIAHFNLGYFYSSSDLEKAIIHFDKALSYFEGQTCSTLYYRILLSKLEIEVTKNKKYRFEEQLNTIKSCPKEVQDYLSFIKVQYNGIEEIAQTLDQKIIQRIKLKQLGESLFPGKSTLHLQDFYLMNTCKTLSFFNSQKNIEDKYVPILIDLVLDTRMKDVTRQKIISSNDINYSNFTIATKLNNLLLKLNNFKKLAPLTDQIYNELFLLYLSQELKEEQELEAPQIDIHSLFKGTDLDDTALINFIRGEDYYYVYLFDNGKMKIFKYTVEEFEVQLQKNYESYISRKEVGNSELRKLIYPIIRNTESKKLSIIPDGILINYPLSEIFGSNRKVFRYSNFREFIDSKAVTVKSSKTQMVSFTDEITLNNDFKKDYPELPIGYEECKRISSLLGLGSKSQSFGLEFNRDNLDLKYCDLLHISSHAYSNMTNRFENYILLRSETGIDKLYGFELYEMNDLPKVVILSACETGIGLFKYGAGVQTLSRAFLDNGTQTVVKTLWKVNEKATAEFMVDMYTNWATGINLYDALEKTKDKFKYHDEYCHPYYWAGFVLEGNPNVKLDLEN